MPSAASAADALPLGCLSTPPPRARPCRSSCRTPSPATSTRDGRDVPSASSEETSLSLCLFVSSAGIYRTLPPALCYYHITVTVCAVALSAAPAGVSSAPSHWGSEKVRRRARFETQRAQFRFECRGFEWLRAQRAQQCSEHDARAHDMKRHYSRLQRTCVGADAEGQGRKRTLSRACLAGPPSPLRGLSRICGCRIQGARTPLLT